MRAIETRYAGCNFRSRLEARWAVFFDTLGIPWEYEPQGFEWVCDHEGCRSERNGITYRYLPDFWLPTMDTWFEVKGKYTEEEMSLHSCFVGSYSQNFAPVTHITAVGDIPRTALSYTRGGDHSESMYLNGCADFEYQWCQCNKCGKIGIEYSGRAARICKHDSCDEGYTLDVSRLDRALEAARSARFN